MQRFRLDQTSSASPLTLLEKIKQTGISQDVCVNDLGAQWTHEDTMFFPFLFCGLNRNFSINIQLFCSFQSLLHLKSYHLWKSWNNGFVLQVVDSMMLFLCLEGNVVTAIVFGGHHLFILLTISLALCLWLVILYMASFFFPL